MNRFKARTTQPWPREERSASAICTLLLRRTTSAPAHSRRRPACTTLEPRIPPQRDLRADPFTRKQKRTCSAGHRPLVPELARGLMCLAAGGIGCDAGPTRVRGASQMSTPTLSARRSPRCCRAACCRSRERVRGDRPCGDHRRRRRSGGPDRRRRRRARRDREDRRTRHGRCRIGQRAGPGHRPCRWRSDRRVGPRVPRSDGARRRRPALRRRAPVLARGASVGGKVSNEDWADAANGWGWVSVFGVVAGGVGFDADRRRPARLAGAGRALRRGAGGARASRRHRRVGRRDRDRRAAAGDPGARHARGHPVRRRAACWPRSPCCSSPT